MTQVSTNSFNLVKNASEKIKGKFFNALGATILTIAPLMLCVFTLYLAPLAVLLFGILDTGYIRYMRELMAGNNPSFKLIFSEFTNPWLEMFLGTILVCMFVGGAVLLFVPAVIFVALYSMSLYFAEYNKSKMPFDAMYDSSKHMKGNYTNMFSFKSLFWLMYVILIVGGLAGVFGAFKLWANYKLWAVVVFVGTYILATLLWSIVTIYYKASTEMFFQELLIYNANKAEKQDKKVEIIEEKVEEVKVEDKPQVKKASTTRKPATAKSTTTKTSASKTSSAKTNTLKATSAKTQSSARKTTTKK